MADVRASPRKLHWDVLLYEDSTSYDCLDILYNLDSYFEQWAYITHDMDVNADGSLKKPHIHLYGKVRNACTVTALAKKLLVPANDIAYVRNVKGCQRYLIHADNPEKAQYQIEEVISNFDIVKVLDEATESKRVTQIIEYITAERTSSVLNVAMYAIENNCWSEFRRSYSIMKDIMNEVRI